MKIKDFSSTLSCTLKCIRFIPKMTNKKIILGFFLFSLLGACTAPTAMLGPAYTLSATGNIYQAGLNYGYNEAITYYTGKTPIENIKKITLKEKNIKKKTLESDAFYKLVEGKIKKVRPIINLSNQ